MGVEHPNGIIKNLIAIIMAGVLGIYGLIVSIIISGAVSAPGDNGNTYSQYSGWAHFSAGLCCGLCCLAAGGALPVRITRVVAAGAAARRKDRQQG